uniref:PH domain-containing protein n=1 Tax=Denticeps clupeoides TaxID=299321 RepID=A0AAY4EWB0_9TELE
MCKKKKKINWGSSGLAVKEERLALETRVRDGAYKLLVASSKPEQVLSASKNLVTCNSRIRAYMSEAERPQEGRGPSRRCVDRASPESSSGDQAPCKGKVALSGLRIPLMWKDTDHFSNKGSSRRVALFCLMKIGSEVFDTEMVVVDRLMTDVCFDGTTVFNAAEPHFELKLELYSCAMEADAPLANTPKKLARKLRSSFGKASGRTLCPLPDTEDPDAFLRSHPIPQAARFSLLAYTTLGMAQAEGSFQSHSLVVLQTDFSSWLPLYGNLCCSLAAQPDCMTRHMMSGFLNRQENIGDVYRCCSLYCVLKGGALSCYYSPEEIEAKVEPTFSIPINQDTEIHVVDKDTQRRGTSLSITNPGGGGKICHLFTAETPESMQEWTESIWQHLYDQSQWLHCCQKLMEIDLHSPCKPPPFLTKQADSVYHDLSIGSPGKFESLTDIIHNKIEETGGRFLIGQEEEREPPHWAAFFEGAHPIVAQKTVMSPEKGGAMSSGSKKRRAPPPPTDKMPYAPPKSSSQSPREKENPSRAGRSRMGRPSLDAKFSTIIHQLQKTHAQSYRSAPLRQMEPPQQAAQPSRPQSLSTGPPPVQAHPVPAPRSKFRKSFREKMNPKAW